MDPYIFYPNNAMTFNTAESDHKRLLDIFCSSEKNIIALNLSAVTQCDSAGLALLIEAKRLAQQRNKICRIEGVTKDIQALAEFCGVDKILFSE